MLDICEQLIGSQRVLTSAIASQPLLISRASVKLLEFPFHLRLAERGRDRWFISIQHIIIQYLCQLNGVQFKSVVRN